MRIAGLIIPYFQYGIMISQNRKHHAARRVDELVTQYARSSGKVRNQYWRLIEVIRRRTSLLSPRVAIQKAVCHIDHEQIVKACYRIAMYRRNWIKHPETWQVATQNPFLQMQSLVKHLFDRYPVPDYLAKAWWSTESDYLWGITLYRFLAQGKSIRQFHYLKNLHFTKRMAGFFMHAPVDLAPQAALRWSQILGMGGNERLARVLIQRSRLDELVTDEPFWETVIRFLIQNQPISTDEIVQIVEFIFQQRFDPAEKIWRKGAGPYPVQPDFSLKGRSLMSLRRHMVHWRSDLIEKGMMPPPEVDPLDFPWRRSAIGEFRCELEGQIWSIEEVLTPRQLQIESKIMNHCVETYLSECVRRKTTIWSMKVKAGQRRRRQLTIEVLPQKKVIFEARGKNNCEPNPTVRQVLNRWALQECLTFSKSV
tara:strand:- start:104811 stop:106082 length:1272 start_codon:yes stop_codon:yes gene_type:complete